MANVWIPRARDFSSGFMHLKRKTEALKKTQLINPTTLKDDNDLQFLYWKTLRNAINCFKEKNVEKML